MYLEILGNVKITEETAAWVRKTAAKYSDILSSNSSDVLESSWDLSLLKDKEKDAMAVIFKQWKDGTESNMSIYWTQRQQKLLGTVRYRVFT